jgi:hypothetical protein
VILTEKNNSSLFCLFQLFQKTARRSARGLRNRPSQYLSEQPTALRHQKN